MSTKKFYPIDLRDLALENQSERKVKGSSSYFLAANIPRNEMGNRKRFQFKEGIETVDGFNVKLKTIETYYLYVRATITGKVFFSYNNIACKLPQENLPFFSLFQREN